MRAAQFADDRWYPSRPDALARLVDTLLIEGAGPIEGAADVPPIAARGLVAPHAGYTYSGRVAGAVYGAVQVPDRVFLVGPNHRGRGASKAVMARGSWRIPGAEVPIDAQSADTFLAHSPGYQRDSAAHSLEHSLELQIPFLVARNPSVSIVPISVFPMSLQDCEALGVSLAAAITQLSGPSLIVASSDMNHFEAASVGAPKDRLAIERMRAMDPEGLFDVVRDHDISMCGVGAATAMLVATVALGATRARLCAYADSGDVNGDKSHVVGYASLAFI